MGSSTIRATNQTTKPKSGMNCWYMLCRNGTYKSDILLSYQRCGTKSPYTHIQMVGESHTPPLTERDPSSGASNLLSRQCRLLGALAHHIATTGLHAWHHPLLLLDQKYHEDYTVGPNVAHTLRKGVGSNTDPKSHNTAY